ncbi:hypothetical protein ACIBI3_02385 [Actinomadura luteofluorescens]|uniref:hypothetical protein n=1 Tax=Actinomadura luteofluorescens TaxID=46163 RepID=UPI00348CA1EC
MLLTMPSGRTLGAPIAAPTTFTDLAAANAGTALTANDLEYNVGAAVAYHRRVAFFQGNGGAQNVATSAWTPITLGEIIDVHAGHSDSSNPARVAADSTGTGDDWYLCVGMVPLAAAASGAGVAGIRLNGSTIYEGAKLPLGSAHAATMMVAELLRVQTGSSQYVELMAYQNSGGTIATQASGTKLPQFAMRWACSNTGDLVAAPSVPRTWTADDLLTADLAGPGQVPLNTHIRDVVRWLRYPPVARVDSRSTTQTLNSGAWTSIQMTGGSIDNYDGHSTSVNNTRYTAPRAGLYFVYGLAAVNEAAGATGYRASRLAVNGTTFYAGTSCEPASTSLGTAVPACAHIRLNAGDYVELQMRPQGNNVTVKSGTGDSSRLIVVWRGL